MEFPGEWQQLWAAPGQKLGRAGLAMQDWSSSTFLANSRRLPSRASAVAHSPKTRPHLPRLIGLIGPTSETDRAKMRGSLEFFPLRAPILPLRCGPKVKIYLPVANNKRRGKEYAASGKYLRGL